MAEHRENRDEHFIAPEPQGGVFDEKNLAKATTHDREVMEHTDNHQAERDLNVTEDDLLEAKELAASYTLEQTRAMMQQVWNLHKRDPNFPQSILNSIEEFLNNDNIMENPEKHEQLINEMKIEAALITNNSPYAEVRSVVDNHDDPNMPCSTIRAWVIGIFFSCAIAFLNGFFEIRYPSITVTQNVPQLLAYPVGVLCAKFLPDWGFTMFGVRHSLNPGPFNKKEHMLITIMASISKSSPYTNYLVWIQYLDQWFGQAWALSFGYQILIALSTNFIGYSMAGLCRRFLVYPAYCVWPESLVTIALNTAFHSDDNPTVLGPFKKMWAMSRMKFFAITFIGMFLFFWLPNTVFLALSTFAWMAWIAPKNRDLATITSNAASVGLGFNPLPTFDWTAITYVVDPLMVPFFSTFNTFIGMFFSGFIIMALYYTNTWGTGSIPITSNKPWDRFGAKYKVRTILDEHGIIDMEKYNAYSAPYLSAGSITSYMFFFAAYSGVLTYAALYHRVEIMMGFRNLVDSFRPSKKKEVEDGRILDVHNRLMQSYKEVPEWWYFITLVLSVACGCAAIAAWPTYTSVGVVFYGILLCAIFVIPTGIVYGMTGIQVTLNVLAEFIGGSFVEGNALAMCFFKSYGYVTCAHALSFSKDLKLAHYVKIAPRFTFWAQMVPTLVTTFLYVGIVQYQVHLKNVCTSEAPFAFTCPGENTFFTAAVLWGTVGPKRLWGVGGTYSPTLIGFPIGVVLVLIFYFLNKAFPRSAFLRNAHPVVMIAGVLNWAPYNLAFIWPAVPVAAFSWLWIKRTFLGLWSKYNFVLSASFSAACALSALIQFFSIAYNDVPIKWWGNEIVETGCYSEGCLLKPMAKGQSFAPAPNGTW